MQYSYPHTYGCNHVSHLPRALAPTIPFRHAAGPKRLQHPVCCALRIQPCQPPTPPMHALGFMYKKNTRNVTKQLPACTAAMPVDTRIGIKLGKRPPLTALSTSIALPNRIPPRKQGHAFPSAALSSVWCTAPCRAQYQTGAPMGLGGVHTMSCGVLQKPAGCLHGSLLKYGVGVAPGLNNTCQQPQATACWAGGSCQTIDPDT
jgi:hypothetical protein